MQIGHPHCAGSIPINIAISRDTAEPGPVKRGGPHAAQPLSIKKGSGGDGKEEPRSGSSYPRTLRTL